MLAQAFIPLAATLLLTGAPLATAQVNGSYYNGTVGDPVVAGGAPGPDSDGKYTIVAEGIRASFVPYGGSISNLFINDTNGVERDLVVGFDNSTYYSEDGQHGHWGAVPGRYANRIKNSTFTIDGTTYHVSANENNGADTLHGGSWGWDYRNFTVVAHTTDSVTFSIVDPAGMEGFPGEVIGYITYTVTPWEWHIKMLAMATTAPTPIMLSSHTYWNLDGFADPNTPLALNHTLHLPYSGTRIGVDSILIPNGTILPNQADSVNDFWTAPKQLGANFSAPEADGNCGAGCTGYDTCFLVNRDALQPYDWRHEGPVATLASSWSGISVDVWSDQDAFQIYSCNSQNGSLALKTTQGLQGNSSRPRVVEQYGCVVMEVEDWIDGINQKEWGRDRKQIFRPGGDPYVLEARYVFRNNMTSATNGTSS